MTLRIGDCVLREPQDALSVSKGGLRIDWPIVGLLMAIALGAVSLRAETIDRVLAVVNNESIITLTDVTAARDLGLQSTDGAADPIRAVLTKLIDRELELAEVERYAPPDPSVEAVDRELAVIRARFATPKAFDDALARSGLDDRHLRETLRQDLRIRAYEDQRFAAAGDRRAAVIADWMAGLRRRGDVIDLYAPGR